MKVRIRMYGELALKFSPEFDIEIEEGSTVEDLLRKLEYKCRGTPHTRKRAQS